MEERIGGFFSADGGDGAVAGIEHGLFREGENFFTDAGEELIPVPARKIPATDTVGEQYIPAVELAESGKIQAEAARAVTGDEKQFGVTPSGRKGACFLQ